MPCPDRGRRAALLPKCVFVCWVVLGEDALRAEEPGTLSLAMAAQLSTALSLELLWQLVRGRGGSGGGTGLEKVPQLTPFQSSGTHNPTPCPSWWKCARHFTFGITDATGGKVGL